eukprot:3941529-Rhodomonas_salina.3
MGHPFLRAVGYRDRVHAVCGTEIGYGATRVHSTEIGYGAVLRWGMVLPGYTRRARSSYGQAGPLRSGYAISPRAAYAMSGTDVGMAGGEGGAVWGTEMVYGRRDAVLRWRMVRCAVLSSRMADAMCGTEMAYGACDERCGSDQPYSHSVCCYDLMRYSHSVCCYDPMRYSHS